MNTRKASRVRTVMGLAIILTLIAATGAVWHVWPAAADDDLKPDLSLSAFMRKKLDASSQILEGLTTEDAGLIQKGAKTLTELSKAEKCTMAARRSRDASVICWWIRWDC